MNPWNVVRSMGVSPSSSKSMNRRSGPESSHRLFTEHAVGTVDTRTFHLSGVGVELNSSVLGSAFFSDVHGSHAFDA